MKSVHPSYLGNSKIISPTLRSHKSRCMTSVRHSLAGGSRRRSQQRRGGIDTALITLQAWSRKKSRGRQSAVGKYDRTKLSRVINPLQALRNILGHRAHYRAGTSSHDLPKLHSAIKSLNTAGSSIPQYCRGIFPRAHPVV